MAVNVIRLVGPKQLTAAVVTEYTVPGSAMVRIDKASFTNTDTAAHTVSIFLVPSAGAAGASNEITVVKTILPGATWNCPDIVGQVLNAGDFIAMQADAPTVLTAMVSGTIFS